MCSVQVCNEQVKIEMILFKFSSGSWQDLKDHMREAGDVCFADVHKDGTGVVEFLRHDDMKYAIKKLDDSRFRSHEVSLIQKPLFKS